MKAHNDEDTQKVFHPWIKTINDRPTY